jgi:hypothetical protein
LIRDMPTDHIRYDILAQEALRGVVRTVLSDAAKKGLPGEHHFKITFATTAPGVRLSDRMRAQYPEAMTIILQHQFWDLVVNDDGFEVGLSFGGVPERLAIPFDAITAFYDPAVQFGFQFETIDAGAAGEPGVTGKPAEKTAKPLSQVTPEPSKTEALSAQPSAKSTEPPSSGPDHNGGGEVVRLDRFRKK